MGFTFSLHILLSTIALVNQLDNALGSVRPPVPPFAIVCLFLCLFVCPLHYLSNVFVCVSTIRGRISIIAQM